MSNKKKFFFNNYEKNLIWEHLVHGQIVIYLLMFIKVFVNESK